MVMTMEKRERSGDSGDIGSGKCNSKHLRPVLVLECNNDEGDWIGQIDE